MAYRTKPDSDLSDNQSDEEGEVFWKKLLSTGQKRKISDQMDTIPNKRRRNNVWLNVANELQLNDALSATHTHKILDTSRGAESYFCWSSADEEVDTVDKSHDRTKKRFAGRIPCLSVKEVTPRDNIDVNFESSPELVKETLVRLLSEPNADLIGNVVDALGVKRSLQFYFLTEDVEQAGGLYLADGSRRRSKGGVFLNLIKRSDEVTPLEKKAAFSITRRMKDKIKRKRRQLRNKLKALMETSISSEPSSKVEVSISEEPLAPESPPTNEILPDVLKQPKGSVSMQTAEASEEGELLSTDDEDG